MQQVIQNLRDGKIEVAETPIPLTGSHDVLIRSHYSLVSTGTEKMLMEFGRANLFDKARQQPEKVKMVLSKLRTDGLSATMDSVVNRLNQLSPMGYSNVGEVVELGQQVKGLKVGDMVVSNGPHADYVKVGQNLVAKVPEGVPATDAVFTVLGAIGLQSVRLAQPTLGETFCVMGCGLIGLITIQLLRANGVQVVAVDYSPEKLELAASFGAAAINLTSVDDLPRAVVSRYGDVDGTILAVNTTSQQPIADSAAMCRHRGRIVLLGNTGMQISRELFFKKELTFQVSCSYGPGRYDPIYEQKGVDYPIGHVRWTEQRNFGAFLGLLAEGKVKVADLVSKRYPLQEAGSLYDHLLESKDSLGHLITYTRETSLDLGRARSVAMSAKTYDKTLDSRVAVIGAGNFARQVLFKAIENTPTQLHTVVTTTGHTAYDAAKRFGFHKASTDVSEALQNPEIDTVFVATRHDSHASLATAALQAHKNVFVEKPLAIDLMGLGRVEEALRDSRGRLMVGFNRRFSPLSVKVMELVGGCEDLSTVITVNAGRLPEDHWARQKSSGGGRIIGEVCHFLDLVRFFHQSEIVRFQTTHLGRELAGLAWNEHVTISLEMANGTMATIHYLANGPKAFPKERIEVFAEGRVLQLNNFLTLQGYGFKDFRSMRLRKQDKGHQVGVKRFMDAVLQGNEAPIPVDEILEITRLAIEIDRAATQPKAPLEQVKAVTTTVH